jgi:RNA polymerase sigma factor (sigma-70 family)
VTHNELSDSEVLTRLRDEQELIGTLYERHAQAVFRYLARRGGPEAGEDLLSDVFIAALNARSRVVVHESGSALPWLYGIASHVLHRHLRRNTRRGIGWMHDPGLDWEAVDSRLDAQAQRDQLRTALGGLSRSERDLLLLVAWEGLTPAEAAVALGISSVAARSRLHRARLRARHSLLPDQAASPNSISVLPTPTTLPEDLT